MNRTTNRQWKYLTVGELRNELAVYPQEAIVYQLGDEEGNTVSPVVRRNLSYEPDKNRLYLTPVLAQVAQ